MRVWEVAHALRKLPDWSLPVHLAVPALDASDETDLIRVVKVEVDPDGTVVLVGETD